MDNLKEALLKYKEITIQIHASLEENDFDSLAPLFDKRKKIIELINTMDYSGEQFKDIYYSIEADEADKSINILMNEKRTDLKMRINKTSKGLVANRSYTKKFSADPIFFSKKL